MDCKDFVWGVNHNWCCNFDFDEHCFADICGILHNPMPIAIESVSIENFLSWLQEQYRLHSAFSF